MSKKYERQPGRNWLMFWTTVDELPLDSQTSCEDLSI